jgi:hypothetical protein
VLPELCLLLSWFAVFTLASILKKKTSITYSPQANQKEFFLWKTVINISYLNMFMYYSQKYVYDSVQVSKHSDFHFMTIAHMLESVTLLYKHDKLGDILSTINNLRVKYE